MSAAVRVILPDGTERELTEGTTGADLAKSLGNKVRKS